MATNWTVSEELIKKTERPKTIRRQGGLTYKKAKDQAMSWVEIELKQKITLKKLNIQLNIMKKQLLLRNGC